MKNLLFVLLTALFILSCAVNDIEKDAKKVAEFTWKGKLLTDRISSGDKSAEPELIALRKEFAEFGQGLKKKYPTKEDDLKFTALVQKAYNEISGNETPKIENKTSVNNSETKAVSDELKNTTKEILKKYFFTKAMELTAVVALKFNDTHFTFIVMAVNGAELCRADGTYFISQAIDGSIAKITLIKDGPIQKSPLYNDNQGIDTELFLHFNRELLLNKTTEELLSKVGMVDRMTSGDKLPDYLLVGRDAFSSNKLDTQAEKDSIANQNHLLEEKRKDLEEKLKGL